MTSSCRHGPPYESDEVPRVVVGCVETGLHMSTDVDVDCVDMCVDCVDGVCGDGIGMGGAGTQLLDCVSRLCV